MVRTHLSLARHLLFRSHSEESQDEVRMKEQTLYSQEVQETPNRGTILLVEDESSLREVISQILSGAGYNVLCSSNALEAADVYGQHANEVQLLLTDMVMPGKNGQQLAREIRQTSPDLKVIFTTGYPQD